MHERRFVLAPLADLAPGLRHPLLRKSVRQLLDAAPPQTIRLKADRRRSLRISLRDMEGY